MFYKNERPDQYPALFNAMALAFPSEDSIRRSTDSGYMMFLTAFGIVMRFWNNPDYYPIYESEYVLQPIATREHGDIQIDFLPGVSAACDSVIRSYMIRDQLEQQAIEYGDCSPRNIGVLPNGYIVVIDAGALTALSDSADDVRRHIRNAQPDREKQADTFRPLINTFNACWPEDQAMPAPENFRHFWKECLAQKNAGLLQAPWQKYTGDQHVDLGIHGVKFVAESYCEDIRTKTPDILVP